MIRDFFVIAFRNLLKRRKRSWLTMIGIFIGVATIVGLMAVGEGMDSAIKEIFGKMGSDKILILAGSGMPLESGAPLVTKNLEAVRTVSGVRYATGTVAKMSPVTFHDEVKYMMVVGLPTDEESRRIVSDFEAFRMEKGRSLKEGDRNKVLVGYLHTVDVFKRKVDVNHKLNIAGHDFDVAGVIARIGAREKDMQVVIPSDVFREMFDEPEKLIVIIAQVKSGEDSSLVAEEIKRTLRRQRNEREGEETFQVQTPKELLETAESVLSIIRAFLLGIAFISLLVGGVGIMNTMYTSVLERTKEIGIMKAVGARNSHIMTLFLIESGILGALGGVLGVVLGTGFSKGVEYLAETQFSAGLIKAKVSFGLIAGALAFSFLVGCIAGVMPARAAAKQNPVDTLRYE